MKIIQIVSTPEIETHEYHKSIQTCGEVIYGLSDEGKLYHWGKKRIALDEPTEDGDKFYYIRGWVEEIDEINKDKDNDLPF